MSWCRGGGLTDEERHRLPLIASCGSFDFGANSDPGFGTCLIDSQAGTELEAGVDQDC